MKKQLLVLLLAPLFCSSQEFSASEVSRWEQAAQRVSIIRDNYGIPHIFGKSDADAVFGLMYAQCEDDFPRVEMNYLEKLGRMAEVKGEKELYNDLLNRLVIDQEATRTDYKKAPAWLKKLCMAFADGINYFLYKHPEQKPALLTRFEPWFPLLWTDGSIGAISTADISMNELRNFYSGEAPIALEEKKEEAPTGSNGFAFAPKITASGKAILYINPHVTFYFRPEVHMISEEGLNAYGAVTWGQFFVYQGFNEHCGWMHTSSYVDAADSYVEKVFRKGARLLYTYNNKQRPVKEIQQTIRIKSEGQLKEKTFTTYYTHHGPIMAKRDGEYLSLRADNRLMNGLIQCWNRTKATGIGEFKKSLELFGNISNNTVYADAEGNIAYWHANRIPKRDVRFDWSKPVDGTQPATEWKGLHTLEETVHIYNPANGWLQNCNSTPFTSAGPANSPLRENYPAYMAPDGENYRGVNAVRVLGENKDYTLEKVIAAGYDTRLAAFEELIPALVRNFETGVSPDDSLFAWLAGPVAVLKNWDYRCNEKSIATTLAVEWGDRIIYSIFNSPLPAGVRPDQVTRTRQFAQTAGADRMLQPLLTVVKELQKNFGRWQVAWGELNRFQRISGDIDNKFDDRKPSIPVGYVSSAWGMLPSYNSRTYPGTVKRYGVNGNSFICAVEFGSRIRAKSLLAGGESSNPSSPHFFDQGKMYATGTFKEVLFYPEDIRAHTEKNYHPGEE